MSKHKPTISIIMPVYNVENFVEKTIKSVLSQTFTDFEFFAIDDGSTDQSGLICDNYAKIDKRLQIIHKQNEGAPLARNVAIEKAQGKYLYFIDSDDYIEPDYLEQMLYLAEKESADLVITGFYMEYYQHNKNITYETNCNDIVYTAAKFKQNAHNYFNNSLLSLPWNKLYRAERIKQENIRFQNTKWDDHHFNMDFLMNISKPVVFSSIKKYHWYRSRKGSETMINYSDPNLFAKRKEHFLHIQRLYEHWEISGEEISSSINSYYTGRILQCLQETCANQNLSYQDKKRRIAAIINDESVIDATNNSGSLSTKFKLASFPIKARSVLLSMQTGYLINTLRKVSPALFIKMKEKEVHG